MSTVSQQPVTREQVVDLLQGVKMTGRKLPSRMVVYGVEGSGKTSFQAFSQSPLYLMSRGETGLETLIDSGQLGEVPHLPQIHTWPDFIAILDQLLSSEHGYKTLVIDAANGFEQLLYEWICEKDFKGDWGPKGFASYAQGYAISSTHWEGMLTTLDRLREKKGMAIILLAHAKIATFKNPAGEDYDRFTPAIHKSQSGLLFKWCDLCLFFDFVTAIHDGDGNKGKARGGTQRIAHCERRAAWDAKNRHGLPETFSLGSSPKEGWANFITAIKTKKGN
jgi:hypothetical protein